MQKLNLIREKIQSYNTITIFRHVHPDMDAYGSQMGLKVALQAYIQKKMYMRLGQ